MTAEDPLPNAIPYDVVAKVCLAVFYPDSGKIRKILVSAFEHRERRLDRNERIALVIRGSNKKIERIFPAGSFELEKTVFVGRIGDDQRINIVPVFAAQIDERGGNRLSGVVDDSAFDTANFGKSVGGKNKCDK